MKDSSEWLAQLLEGGLLKASVVPPPAIRELRDITRYQVQQVRDWAREVNRLCKVVEDAGIKKLTSVAAAARPTGPAPTLTRGHVDVDM